MNSSERAYAQGKLTWHISSVMKLTANYIFDHTKSQPYDRQYFYNPDGNGDDYNFSHTVIASSRTVSVPPRSTRSRGTTSGRRSTTTCTRTRTIPGTSIRNSPSPYDTLELLYRRDRPEPHGQMGRDDPREDRRHEPGQRAQPRQGGGAVHPSQDLLRQLHAPADPRRRPTSTSRTRARSSRRISRISRRPTTISTTTARRSSQRISRTRSSSRT